MKTVIIDNKKMLKLFLKKEDIVVKAKKIEKDYEEITKKYEEDIKKLTNLVGKIDTKLRPMIATEQSKLTMGEYDEIQRVYQSEGNVTFEILTPDTIREEYIAKMKEKNEAQLKKEKEDKKNNGHSKTISSDKELRN